MADPPRKPSAGGTSVAQGDIVPTAAPQPTRDNPPMPPDALRKQQAEIERARRVGTGGVIKVNNEYRGTGAQRASGRLEIVDATDAGEGANPHGMIRRAQVKDPIRRAVRKDQLRYRHFLAADKFRDDIEQAEHPGHLGSQFGQLVRVDGGGAGGGSSAEGVSAAKRRVQRAWQAIGLRLAGVVSWCVVPKPEGNGGPRYGSVRGYEECNRLKHGKGGEMLRDALDKLADHYGLEDPPRPRDFA